MPRINFGKTESYSVVPDGKYLCRVQNIVEKTTKTEKEMWTVWLSIENEGDHYGNILFQNLVFDPNCAWLIKTFYEATLNKPMLGDHDCVPSDLEGKYVNVIVKGTKKYEGKDQPVISHFEPVGEKEEDYIPF